MSLLEYFYDTLTDHFTTPATVADAPHIYEMSMAAEAIRTISAMPGQKLTADCRVYIGGRRASPFEGKRFIDLIAKYRDLSCVPWHDLTKGAPFLIFVNKASLFSEAMDIATRGMLGKFCDQFEPEGVSIEHHVIIGQYAETDFGVHVDDPADRVFHFNLGPVGKEMILWPREPFIERYGTNPTRPLGETDLEGSARYEMPVGSCFFLPADYYHVGRSPEGVSVVVAIALSRQSSEEQLAAVHREIKNAIAPIEDLTPYWTNFRRAPTEAQQKNICAAFARHDYAGWLQHARARARSNGWISEVRPLGAPDIPPGEFDLTISAEAPPQVVSAGHVLHVYARGQHIALTDEGAISWTRSLLAGDPVRLSQEEVLAGIEKRNAQMLVAAWFLATGGATADPASVLETAQ
ncbi:MAG: hypothetical protein F4103_07120 [Boseongicola sp. SB0673_bin_14]|nr:hypothetical protein [Boseongicola sp. SB0673_bin_14]